MEIKRRIQIENDLKEMYGSILTLQAKTLDLLNKVQEMNYYATQIGSEGEYESKTSEK